MPMLSAAPSQPTSSDLPAAYLELQEWIGEGLEHLDGLPDAETRDAVYRLLQGIDTLHREGLGRLMDLLGEADSRLLDRLGRDPVVGWLLELYDLSLPAMPVAAPPVPQPRAPSTPEPAPQPLELGTRRPLRGPRWVTVATLADLSEGQVTAVGPEGTALLLVRLAGEIQAYADGCPPGSPLTLRMGRLEGTDLVCPWHGCRYDVRTGRRIDGEGRLAVYPVAVREGAVLVALGTQELEVLAG
ncbi:MAG: Rieske 2Fe-2S domain-containing protein [Chloroflexi bacterium]|nr:Rieske 2Fe-2S domain-containing protein [Chloroflexota bacterium]